MDLRAQWQGWRRQVAASRFAVAATNVARKLAGLGGLAWKQAGSLARTARARTAHWPKQLASLASTIWRRAACILAEAGSRLTEWRRRAMAGPVVASIVARNARWRQGVARRARAELAWYRSWLRTGPLAPATARVDRWFAARRRAVEGRYRIEVATPHSRALAAIGAGLLALLVALPAFAGRNLINELIFVFTMLVLAQYWNLLAGYAGLVSVGQQAFVGLGGYLLFALTVHRGFDPLAAIAAAGLIAAILAIPTALVVFRLRGAYFAIGTWVVAEVYRLVFAQVKWLGGGTGTSLPPFVTNEVAGITWVKGLFGVSTSAARDIITYWTALTLAAGTVLLVYLILRSRYGLALAAIRDSERAAESVGVDNFRTKLKVYIVAAAGTGMVGALIYLQKARISPDAAFSVLDWTAYVIFIVVIGGIGTIEGPIVGVLVFYVLQTNLAHFGTWYLILLGAFAIVIMLFAPKGIWGYLSERYGLVIFPIRRRLVATGEERDKARINSAPPA
jgi:branched-chain amino acid transport system permease protein